MYTVCFRSQQVQSMIMLNANVAACTFSIPTKSYPPMHTWCHQPWARPSVAKLCVPLHACPSMAPLQQSVLIVPQALESRAAALQCISSLSGVRAVFTFWTVRGLATLMPTAHTASQHSVQSAGSPELLQLLPGPCMPLKTSLTPTIAELVKTAMV